MYLAKKFFYLFYISGIIFESKDDTEVKMIQPIAITSYSPVIKPILFSAQKGANNNQTQNKANALDVSSRELSPSYSNSSVAQKLDYFA